MALVLQLQTEFYESIQRLFESATLNDKLQECDRKNRVFLIFQEYFCHLQMAKFLPSQMENIFHIIEKTSYGSIVNN